MIRSARALCGLVASVLLAAGHIPASAQSPSALDVDLGPGINEAFISQLGENQRASVEQRNAGGGLLSGKISQSGSGNAAAILMQGGSLSGSINQAGSDSEANLLLDGSDLAGSITQFDDKNAATLEVRGQSNRGAIEQFGGGNSGALIVKGYGQDVTLIQGGGVSSQTAPISIGSDTPTGLPITIRQY
jgi:hypothetical protein